MGGAAPQISNLLTGGRVKYGPDLATFRQIYGRPGAHEPIFVYRGAMAHDRGAAPPLITLPRPCIYISRYQFLSRDVINRGHNNRELYANRKQDSLRESAAASYEVPLFYARQSYCHCTPGKVPFFLSPPSDFFSMGSHNFKNLPRYHLQINANAKRGHLEKYFFIWVLLSHSIFHPRLFAPFILFL